MMSVEANRSSTTAAHEGYNYLLVTKGKVKCHFSDGREEKSLDLGAGDAVAFSTRLHHKVEAVDGEVDIVVARSAWGGKPHRAED
jgi:mannose-6-phosphate isomerase-like protein (cupin superfamily)